VLRPRGKPDGHVYLVDASGRKIAVVWGRTGEKLATAALLSLAPEMFGLLGELAPAPARAAESARKVRCGRPRRDARALGERAGARARRRSPRLREALRR